ncbi:unnamed protein product [Rangifer tarandus platyrhynchus]|uniref:Uncharacterized protein n=2 Tax=Rangifer tarandus platyrhynchus TaxID=3082113 RepID=A0AC59ZCB5_RANTA|nr:unnamed protein product [Rangifer tarandus platyrhynchus]
MVGSPRCARLLAGLQDLQAHMHTRGLLRVSGGANGKNGQEVSLAGVVPASPTPRDAWAAPGRGGPSGWKGAGGGRNLDRGVWMELIKHVTLLHVPRLPREW